MSRPFPYLVRSPIVGFSACCVLALAPTAQAPSPALGGTYYIAPDGADTNDGATRDAPWQNWAHAFSMLQPGDTLLVLEGTWTNAPAAEPGDPLPHLVDARLPYVNCDPNLTPDPDLGTPYANGLPGAPITVRAEKERTVFLRSTGSRSAIQALNCSHWTFEGLCGEAADLPSSRGGFERGVFQFIDSDHVTLRRMLGAKNNRYFNDHVYELIRCHDCLLEENEAYDFHRHGFSVLQSSHVTLTRNYAHARSRDDIPGGYGSHTPDDGDEGITCYFSHHCLVQNCIVEDSEGIQATGDANTILGCIAIGGDFGFRFAANCQDSGAQPCFLDLANPNEDRYPTGNRGENLISIDAELAAFDSDSCGFSTWTNVTAIGNGVWSFVGRDRLVTPGFDTSFKVEYGLSIRSGPAPSGVGFLADGSIDGGWRGSHLNAWGHPTGFSPAYSNPVGTWSDWMEVDPQLGACLVFVPETSPMWLGPEECIGANVLYRYEDGELTDEPLWHPVIGGFPGGAMVAGMNHVFEGECLRNVHQRLNVNCNGCTLPSWYGQD